MIITRALVVAHSDYRDNDRMVTLLSQDMGRVDAIARGCKKPKSPLMNATERFTAGEFSLAPVRGRFTMTGCQIHESFYPLREDLDKLTAGAYVLNLTRQASLPGQAAEDLLNLSLVALAHLSYAPLPLPIPTMAFELHLLKLLGQAPRVDCCAACGGALPDQGALFDARAGGALCPACARSCASDPTPSPRAPLSYGARRILWRVPQTRFDVIDKLNGHPDWPEAARHARAFIREHLDPPRLWPALTSPTETE